MTIIIYIMCMIFNRHTVTVSPFWDSYSTRWYICFTTMTMIYRTSRLTDIAKLVCAENKVLTKIRRSPFSVTKSPAIGGQYVYSF